MLCRCSRLRSRGSASPAGTATWASIGDDATCCQVRAWPARGARARQAVADVSAGSGKSFNQIVSAAAALSVLSVGDWSINLIVGTIIDILTMVVIGGSAAGTGPDEWLIEYILRVIGLRGAEGTRGLRGEHTRANRGSVRALDVRDLDRAGHGVLSGQRHVVECGPAWLGEDDEQRKPQLLADRHRTGRGRRADRRWQGSRLAPFRTEASGSGVAAKSIRPAVPGVFHRT